jgi:hypothetical protein
MPNKMEPKMSKKSSFLLVGTCQLSGKRTAFPRAALLSDVLLTRRTQDEVEGQQVQHDGAA